MLKGIKNYIYSIVIAAGLTVVSSTNVFAATYNVGQGDSLFTIGKLFNTNSSIIMKDNNLTSTTIYPGQTLYVSCKTYTVQSGDSLYTISKKFVLNLGTLRKANNQWTDNIYPGQVLNIPVSSVVQVPAPSSSFSYTNADVDLLARLIMAEAQGESYNGKVAVGAVVVNRANSGQFPSNIHDVIYQTINGYYQFTPVLNGWINYTADSDSIKAAYAALNGTDPTKGALFYFDNTTTNKWLWSKQISIIIGKLVFAY